MKTITIIGLMMLSIVIGQESIGNKNINYYQMFLSDYSKVREWEGNYANLEFDRGGETYAGIARNFNKKWEGWKVLDKYKRYNFIKWNDIVEEIEPMVTDYYFQIWMRDKYYLIEDPFVRNYLFDYRNSGNIAYRHMKEVLNYHGFETEVGAYMDKKSLSALNKINPIIFILHLKEVRLDYYRSVVNRSPELEIYLKGWLNRAHHINIPS